MPWIRFSTNKSEAVAIIPPQIDNVVNVPDPLCVPHIIWKLKQINSVNVPFA